MSGIYVHIPFCRQKCAYCDFHFSTTFEAYRQRMVDALCKELVERSHKLDQHPVETVYLGGGTPSVLTHEELTRILEIIQKQYVLTPDFELTLEANPEDINLSTLAEWKQLGINRLSIGVQSFRAQDLVWMNRAHSANEAEQAVKWAQEIGFENITVDLIYGLPNLSLDEWEAHVQQVIDWGVPHVSAYCLTVESRTELEKKIKSGVLIAPGDEEQAEQFLSLVELLKSAGIEQYEISNFARPGQESRHNSAYWNGVPYLGIGPSAHSFDGNARRWNVANNHRYMQLLEKNECYFETENLSVLDRFNERLLTGLRTREGVVWESLASELVTDAFKQRVHDFEKDGWIICAADRFSLSQEGRLRADYIASELFAAPAH